MKKILNISLIVFVILFQLKSFAEEKNYHKELITDWSRIFPDKNRNAAGPKFFKYIIDKKITYKDFIEFNRLYCAVSGSLIDPNSDSEFLYIKESKYLRIKPLNKYGAPARGATVTLITDQRKHSKTIDAGSGYLCQMEPVAHYGIRKNEKNFKVEVKWTDGTKNLIRITSLNQTVTIKQK